MSSASDEHIAAQALLSHGSNPRMAILNLLRHAQSQDAKVASCAAHAGAFSTVRAPTTWPRR